MGRAAPLQPVGGAGTLLGEVLHRQGQNRLALVLAERPAAGGHTAQHGHLPPGAAGEDDGIQTDLAGLHVSRHRQRPEIGTFQLVENALADDAGKGDPAPHGA